ncbi:hypothetical protein [Paenarthrobacter aurescens]|uniref:hypothetical protein n=1 Tax=Paenarthrobacter aurescens TaxID=43663 RepID=UPI0035ECA881
MNWESNAVLENHLYHREVWAKRSRKTFYETDPEAHLLASFILEALADFTTRTSGKPWPLQTNEGRYSAGLVVSFVRSQFMVVRCAEESHLIEGTTLLRKQLEVLARLNELDNAGEAFQKLLKKTPKLAAMKSTAREIYGPYSEVAHSSAPDHFHLLGTGEAEGYKDYMSFYPEFSRNSYVLLYNRGLVFIEFWLWLQSYNERHAAPWDLDQFTLSASAAFRVMAEWDVKDLVASVPNQA